MLIHLETLGKTFGEKVVLHDVTASVEREDRIGMVGQNGAGKTTLLKILTGEYQDYDGEFSVTHGVTLGYLTKYLQNRNHEATGLELLKRRLKNGKKNSESLDK